MVEAWSGSRMERLTANQRQSLALVAQHYSSKAAARLLGISPAAFDDRLRKAMQTVGASSRREAVRVYLQHEEFVHEPSGLHECGSDGDASSSSPSADDDHFASFQKRQASWPSAELGELAGDYADADSDTGVGGDDRSLDGGAAAPGAIPHPRIDPQGIGDDLRRPGGSHLSWGGASHDLKRTFTSILIITIIVTVAIGALLSGLLSLQTMLERTGPPHLVSPPRLWPYRKDTEPMRIKRIAALEMVVPELRATELSVDAALIQTARLAATMLEAQRSSGMSATFGHRAFAEAAGTFNTLVVARDRIVQTHLSLGEIKAQMGLATYLGGNGGDKPDEVAPEIQAPGLRVVA